MIIHDISNYTDIHNSVVFIALHCVVLCCVVLCCVNGINRNLQTGRRRCNGKQSNQNHKTRYVVMCCVVLCCVKSFFIGGDTVEERAATLEKFVKNIVTGQ